VLAVLAVVFYPRGPAPDQPRAEELTRAGNDLVTRFAGSNPPDSTLLQSAFEQFQEATQADRHYALAWNNLGRVQQVLGDTIGAEQSFRRAIKEDRGLATAYSNLGTLLAATGRSEEARKQFVGALKVDTTLVAAHLGLAGVLEKTEPDSAIGHYERAAALGAEAERIIASNNEGFLLVTLDRPEDAAGILEPAVGIWPRRPSLWKNLGLAYLLENRMVDADSAFTRALRLVGGKYPQAEAGQAEARRDTVRARDLWTGIEQENSDPANPNADPAVAELARRALRRLQSPPDD